MPGHPHPDAEKLLRSWGLPVPDYLKPEDLAAETAWLRDASRHPELLLDRARRLLRPWLPTLSAEVVPLYELEPGVYVDALPVHNDGVPVYEVAVTLTWRGRTVARRLLHGNV